MKTPHSEWKGNDWLNRCAWCAQEIPDGHEVLGISLKFHPGQGRRQWAGTVQPLRLAVSARTVPMMVCGDGSPAKQAGNDAMFQVCSDACGKALQNALRQDVSLGEVIAEKPKG